jgi:hypothetical protein
MSKAIAAIMILMGTSVLLAAAAGLHVLHAHDARATTRLQSMFLLDSERNDGKQCHPDTFR